MCGTMGAYDDVVLLPLSGRVRTIDRCIHHLVAALNAGGLETVACCCGHGKQPGRIDLADGRVLVIKSRAEADMEERLANDRAVDDGKRPGVDAGEYRTGNGVTSPGGENPASLRGGR